MSVVVHECGDLFLIIVAHHISTQGRVDVGSMGGVHALAPHTATATVVVQMHGLLTAALNEELGFAEMSRESAEEG